MRVGKILPQVKNILRPCYCIKYSTFGMCSKSIFEKSCESARPTSECNPQRLQHTAPGTNHRRISLYSRVGRFDTFFKDLLKTPGKSCVCIGLIKP